MVNAVAPFPRTASSVTFGFTTQNVTLVNGVNEIRLETTAAASFADIDWLEITGNRIVPTNCANAIGTTVLLATMPRTSLTAPQVRAYPNPTAGSTTFEVNLAVASPVRIALFSLTGAKVADVPTSPAALAIGTHQIEYQNNTLQAGVYFYVVTTTSGTYRAKLMVE